MKLSCLLSSVTVLAWSILLTRPATAIDFSFSFENVLSLSGRDGTVTGVIRGLEEGTGSATSVEVLSNTAGFGLGEYVGSPTRNSWTVLDGNLVAFEFTELGRLNTPPEITSGNLFFDSSANPPGLEFRAILEQTPFRIIINPSGFTTEDVNLTFTRLDDDIESVPEPTSILSLLVVGAAAIGTALKRKQT